MAASSFFLPFLEGAIIGYLNTHDLAAIFTLETQTKINGPLMLGNTGNSIYTPKIGVDFDQPHDYTPTKNEGISLTGKRIKRYAKGQH